MLKALLMIDTTFCSSQEYIRFLKLKVLLEDSYLRPHVHLRSTLVRLGRDPRFGKSRVAKRKPREQQKIPGAWSACGGSILRRQV